MEGCAVSHAGSVFAGAPIFSMMTSWLGSTSYSGSSSKGLRGIDLSAPCSGDSSKLTSCKKRCTHQTAQECRRLLNLSRTTLNTTMVGPGAVRTLC